MTVTKQAPSIDELRALFAPILEAGPARLAVVFGSMATGEAHEHSDIDMIVVADTSRPWDQRAQDFKGVRECTFRPIDLLIYTPKEMASLLGERRGFIVKALAEGAIIYERPGAPPLPLSMAEIRRGWMDGTLRPDPKKEAERWLNQAENDLLLARVIFKEGFPAQTCFHSQQVAEKSLKALAFLRGDRIAMGHSVAAFLTMLTSDYPALDDLLQYGEFLDEFYVGTRYPDVHEGGIAPFQAYSKRQAEDALTAAQKFFDLAKSLVHPPANPDPSSTP